MLILQLNYATTGGINCTPVQEQNAAKNAGAHMKHKNSCDVGGENCGREEDVASMHDPAILLFSACNKGKVSNLRQG